MKAAVIRAPGCPHRKGKRATRASARTVQVKVAWCGICGTDLHEYMGGPLYIPLDRPHPVTGVQAPVIIGHEMSGEVTAVGEGVESFKVGPLEVKPASLAAPNPPCAQG